MTFSLIHFTFKKVRRVLFASVKATKFNSSFPNIFHKSVKNQIWRWLFHQQVVGKKYGFSPPPPRSKYWSYDQTVWMRRIQTSSSKPPMFDYTCDEHVVNTHWLKAKNGQKTLIWIFLIPNGLIIRPILASGGGRGKNHIFPYNPWME